MSDEFAFQETLDDLAEQLWPSGEARYHAPDLLDRYAGICAVFADWLEEQGDSRAEGYRWLSQHRKLPRRSNDTWDWWRFGDDAGAATEDLPRSIWDRLPGRPNRNSSLCKEYSTRRDAESALCKAVFFLKPDA